MATVQQKRLAEAQAAVQAGFEAVLGGAPISANPYTGNHYNPDKRWLSEGWSAGAWAARGVLEHKLGAVAVDLLHTIHCHRTHQNGGRTFTLSWGVADDGRVTWGNRERKGAQALIDAGLVEQTNIESFPTPGLPGFSTVTQSLARPS